MTAILKLLYHNLGLAGTWTASTSEAALPPSNAGDRRRGLPWRSTSASNQWLKVHLPDDAGDGFVMGESEVGGPDEVGGAGSAIAVQGLALIDSNLTTRATVTIQAHTSDVWTEPAFSQSLTPWDASRRGVMPVFFPVQSLPWWRILLDDAENPNGFLQVGVAALGPVLAWERAGRPGVATGPGIGITPRLIDPSLRGRSPAGTPYRFALPKLFAIDIPTNVLSEAWAFDALWPVIEAAGLTRDMVCSLYAEDPSGSSTNRVGIARTTNLYGAFDGELSMPEQAPFFGGSLTLVESR